MYILVQISGMHLSLVDLSEVYLYTWLLTTFRILHENMEVSILRNFVKILRAELGNINLFSLFSRYTKMAQISPLGEAWGRSRKYPGSQYFYFHPCPPP